MDPLQNGLAMLFKKKNKTSVENSIAVVGVTKALLIGITHCKQSVQSVNWRCSLTKSRSFGWIYGERVTFFGENYVVVTLDQGQCGKDVSCGLQSKRAIEVVEVV